LNGGLLKKDWALALLISLVFIVATISGAPILEKMERVAYDTGVSLTNRNPGDADRIAIIAIDDASIERIGRWPWSRTELADMLNKMRIARAKAVGLQIFPTEPTDDVGLTHVRKIKSYIAKTNFPRSARKQVRSIQRQLNTAERAIDADAQLAYAMSRRKNVYLPMYFEVGEPEEDQESTVPKFVRKNKLSKILDNENSSYPPISATRIEYPLPKFGKVAAGLGHFNLNADGDGGIRKEVLVYEHQGDYYPSLPLLLAARSLNVRLSRIDVNLATGIGLGRIFIRTDKRLGMLTAFYPSDEDNPPFSTYSFADVRDGKIPLRTFRNKIVIIGPTAAGVGSPHLTPVNASMYTPELTANIVASILNQDFYTRSTSVMLVEAALFLGVIFYLAIVLPRFRANVAALITLLILFVLLIAGQYSIVSQKVWLQSVAPAILLVLGHIVLTVRHFLTNEQLKESVESDSAQTNRMLGLTFQSQGQLDMALDKFRKLPIDDSVHELFYNLALDFERKRQFNKAASCYENILQHNRKFRDAKERRDRASQMEGTIIMGARGGSGGTLIVDGGVTENPTLGRYQVERELGRGAMGTVYYGKDPKINRVVAIKTLDLSAEFEGNELDQVKERFFREAETAGRLNHPNIVTIYDAGEEHDLAYIAMEYLEGHDLTEKIGGKKPLPVKWVLEIILQVADALNYAHELGVVHRDIKPANIMYNEKDGSIKVTDFGIARITDSSKTRTGVVLGTPSYMSPEQFSGKRVDGRSDLFSLGVTMFEMLTGEQPFGGDSLAELMYQITNKKHPNIMRQRDKLPTCVRTIIDKALQKEPDDRYQSGEQFAQAVRRCLVSLDENR
jgi:CHASE2 domain-containing sensor protein/tRNA A-37 threonylcarbamoyl transferase component Bud32